MVEIDMPVPQSCFECPCRAAWRPYCRVLQEPITDDIGVKLTMYHLEVWKTKMRNCPIREKKE